MQLFKGEQIMTTKVSWHDLHNYSSQEIKKKYKLNDRQLEQSVRRHMDGASRDEREGLYKDVWDSKNKK